MLPLLAAISGSAGAAAPCLARACLQLKAKSRLAAGKIAAGLQDIIAGHCTLYAGTLGKRCDGNMVLPLVPRGVRQDSKSQGVLLKEPRRCKLHSAASL